MKNQYVADVNDFLKYALLRALVERDGLAVIWMLTASDLRTDGRRLGYLERPETYRRIDPQLYDFLQEVVRSERRTIEAIETEGLLPRATFMSKPLLDDLESRNAYFEHVWHMVTDRPFVFFDPDNGLEAASTPKGRRNSSKYLYWGELARAYALGHGLIVYQHFNRVPRRVFLQTLSARICELTGCDVALGVTTAHVAFLVVPQPEWSGIARLRLVEFCTRSAPLATLIDLGPQAQSALA